MPKKKKITAKLTLSNAEFESVAERKTLAGEEHIVVPVIAVQEGVLNNIFYSKEEIATFASAWNGVPVPVNHPKDENNNPLSANSPEFEETTNIGKLYNAKSELGKLKGEIWINIEKANKLGFEDIIERFDNGEMMEVSTGLWGNIEVDEGVHNNTKYKYVIKNIRPDHLALLPEDEGACSIDDGCGAMRTNVTEVFFGNDCGCEKCDEKQKKAIRTKAFNALRDIGKNTGLIVNDTSYEDVRSQLHAQVNDQYDDWVYIADVFDDYFIYEVDGQLYKRTYALADDIVTISTLYAPVVRKTSYESITDNTNNDPGDKTMDKEKLVAELIDNKATQYDKADKDALLALDEALLKKIHANTAEGGDSDDKPAADPAKGEKQGELPLGNGITENQLKILEKMEANADLIDRWQAAEGKRVDTMREAVVANVKGMTKEIVDTMPVEAVEALHNTIRPVPSFAGNAALPETSGGDEWKDYKKPSVVDMFANRDNPAEKKEVA